MKPLYILEKKFETNELVIGFEDDPLLFKKEIVVTDLHWIAGRPPKFPLECTVRLRHRQELQKSKVKNLPAPSRRWKSKIVIECDKPQKAVTPGQFAVFYKGKRCLGGGVIVEGVGNREWGTTPPLAGGPAQGGIDKRQ